jgi:hypothetical protein
MPKTLNWERLNCGAQRAIERLRLVNGEENLVMPSENVATVASSLGMDWTTRTLGKQHTQHGQAGRPNTSSSRPPTARRRGAVGTIIGGG